MNGPIIAISVIALVALQQGNHATDLYLDRPCSEITFTGKITKKLFSDGAQKVVGLIVKLDNGRIAEVEIPKYEVLAMAAGAEAEFQRLLKGGPKVHGRATLCADDSSPLMLDLLPP